MPGPIQIGRFSAEPKRRSVQLGDFNALSGKGAKPDIADETLESIGGFETRRNTSGIRDLESFSTDTTSHDT